MHPPHDPHGRVWLKAMTRPQLLAWATATLGARPAQADNLWAGLHRRLAADFSELHDIDAELRARLATVARIDALALHAIHRAADGTCKLALRTDDGAIIESVLIPDVTRHDEAPRATLCVSSQVGCAMNCQFCLTAKMGLVRHLSTAEIVEQLILARRSFPELWISNVVFMGMGEPLHNIDAVIAATHILCDDHGLGLSQRRVTVSTSGLIPQIQRFFAESPARLAISINATTDAVRDRIMPVNRKYPLADLLAALRALPLRRRERLTLEYVLLADLNDSDDDAQRLADLVAGLPCKLNLIPFNPHPGSEFRRPAPDRVAAFKAALQARHLNTSIRTTRGDERMAACGQLGQVGQVGANHGSDRPAGPPGPRQRRPPGLALL
ncbi:MAG: 23S rRNA (adenine(2503)-C(2))-methyltransferase RlmN [Nannocystis sp.]|uniref:23S rRNA (adenine(2503)-C(2))-methyltransferase RlmN n=1 Tax=Nannocystis sp. TaxID=1962667 RepID=UPI0024288AD0|nr:23S rRNA (adenine(2503)-C(2))-methyltransferase RlmN [Nannocystis sp.]MBK9757881.1 23S rRNA (adenine(2503)-C(2))-methyltransferase RlmN [Nannocystis sp.]